MNEYSFKKNRVNMAPRTDEQNEALRAAARARIMDAALTLFGQQGYESTSVKQIAQAAGVAQGLLYNYFESKEHLLAAIFQQSMADVRESFVLAEQSPSEKRVIALIQAAFAIIRRNERFWRLSYAVRMQTPILIGLGLDLRTWTNEIRSTATRYLREVGVPNPEIEGEILFALIDGVSQHYVVEPETYPLTAVEAALIAKYTRSAP